MRAIVWAGIICLAVIFIVGGYNVLASNVLHGPVNGRSLYVSVKDASGGGGPLVPDEHDVCRQAAQPLEWECSVPDPDGSGGAGYSVRVRSGSSCWDGTGGGAGLPERISGCVHLQE